MFKKMFVDEGFNNNAFGSGNAQVIESLDANGEITHTRVIISGTSVDPILTARFIYQASNDYPYAGYGTWSFNSITASELEEYESYGVDSTLTIDYDVDGETLTFTSICFEHSYLEENATTPSTISLTISPIVND